ncbi:hypothetical protein S1OALGB6SA_384 [Olavius algarvensis spirochete endosymbiont]|nr:hypothetical protein S1OALGB6SA_384 [Olavius algarvensis spirochete endosymbiont]
MEFSLIISIHLLALELAILCVCTNSLRVRIRQGELAHAVSA